MDISYYDFKNLPDNIQYEMVKNMGCIVSDKAVNDLQYVLYELSNFTVEIVYDLKRNKMAAMNIFHIRNSYVC
ncbi:hypothetical protein BXY58_3376 [Epilithonimonas arachidiradicis]|uniref:Uncharacterized protein n=1 Tax=Epilithonimonas arachidiradicis TaxID=1617282 RepID=A0A420CL58_9FLAO|nr:hypothetical protein BXY58_3376 [Epilithonimonas arachidiradicis]GGG60364.1 hypothetical protein GCM10007332_22510 [Epilithonimonas arachidiradicis]